MVINGLKCIGADIVLDMWAIRKCREEVIKPEPINRLTQTHSKLEQLQEK